MDTPKLLAKSFQYDIQYCKLNKFIKDADILEQVQQILSDHYILLKDQFNILISTSKCYPMLDRYAFVKACGAWNLIDKFTLTANDASRVYLASICDTQDMHLEENYQLCRFKFIEAVVRLANEKFCRNGIKNLPSALEKVIKIHIAKTLSKKYFDPTAFR